MTKRTGSTCIYGRSVLTNVVHTSLLLFSFFFSLMVVSIYFVLENHIFRISKQVLLVRYARKKRNFWKGTYIFLILFHPVGLFFSFLASFCHLQHGTIEYQTEIGSTDCKPRSQQRQWAIRLLPPVRMPQQLWTVQSS